MSGRWLVMNIGCIECGVTSAVVGLFDDQAKADETAVRLNRDHHWRQSGQNSFEVFDLEAAPSGEYVEGAPVQSQNLRWRDEVLS